VLQKNKQLNVSDGVLRLRVGGDGSQVARSKNITNFVLSVLNINMESCRQDSNIHTLMLWCFACPLGAFGTLRCLRAHDPIESPGKKFQWFMRRYIFRADRYSRKSQEKTFPEF